MFCWQCGKEIYPGAFFCTNCGTKVVESQELGQQDSVRMVAPVPVAAPVEVQEPVAPPAPGPIPVPVTQPVEVQEPVAPPASAPVTPPVEVQEPVAPPAPVPVPVPVTQPVEVQEPVTPPAPVPVPVTAPVAVQEPVTPPAPVPAPAPPAPGYMPTIPAEQNPAPKPLKKGILITMITVAVLVFLIGVAGAFYFADAGDDSDGGNSQGRREELEDDDTFSHGEDVGEFSQFEKPDDSDAEKEDETGNNSETRRDDSDAADSTDSGEDSIEEKPTEEAPSFPWENPMEGNRIPAFSGRDIYPGIDGYAEGKPGDSMHTYWFDYTVTGAYVCNEYGGYLPKAGYEILVVEMAVRNTFDEWIPMFDDDFQAQWNDISDDAYVWPIEDAELLGEDVLPAYYVLEEGQMVMGLLLFEVPVGYTDFSLAYWEIFDDNTYGDLFFLDFTVDRNQVNTTV